jgi:hypothetical protein
MGNPKNVYKIWKECSTRGINCTGNTIHLEIAEVPGCRLEARGLRLDSMKVKIKFWSSEVGKFFINLGKSPSDEIVPCF